MKTKMVMDLLLCGIYNFDLRNLKLWGLIGLMKKELWRYLNERVVVRAFGVEYTGIFKGADEEWVFLQCETTWVQIPWLEITSFKPAGSKEESRLYREIPGEPDSGIKKKKARTLETELKLIKGEKEEGSGEGNEEKSEGGGNEKKEG